MRHKKTPHREILPDPKYGNVIVAKFINCVMKKGKKAKAQTIVYHAFDAIAEKTKQDPLEVFDAAMKNVGPTMETKSRRVGGANYQVPLPVRPERRVALAMHWILMASRLKHGSPMEEKLAGELIAAAKGEGDAVKKKMDVHRMADANRAFAHFAR